MLRSGDRRVGALVAHRVGLDVVASVSLIDWLQIGVDAPFLVFQARDVGEARDAVLDAQDLSAVGVGDRRFLTKIRVLSERAGHGVAVAVLPALTVPTGFPAGDTGSYVGEGQITFAPEIAVSRSFSDGPLTGLRLAVDVGYRLRPEERTVVNVTVGHELTYRAGVAYDVGEQLALALSMNVGTSAFQPFPSGLEENPLEVLGAVDYEVLPALVLQAGLGKGILSGFGTPDLRAFLGVRFAPAPHPDRDGDGVENAKDSCPDDPEDKDGFQDPDGCPDRDNDGDGVLDAADGAPDDPEDKDGFQDPDGVPDPDNDGDGVQDRDDACPLEPGPAERLGCPPRDRDGDGVVDEEDACPDEAGVAALAGCPDRDKDGLADAADRCPARPGLKQQKGCPDTDGDGFIDPEDGCPPEAEIVKGVDDQDGCPDKGKTVIKLTRERIEILDKVYFDVAKDTIQQRNFTLLDQVATVITSHPELTNVRVEGHTDSDGSDEANRDRSDRRAKSVVRYLVEKGVDAARLQAVGYGESRPVAPNDSKANKKKNRRVEFVIVEIDGVPAEAQTEIETKAKE